MRSHRPVDITNGRSHPAAPGTSLRRSAVQRLATHTGEERAVPMCGFKAGVGRRGVLQEVGRRDAVFILGKNVLSARDD